MAPGQNCRPEPSLGFLAAEVAWVDQPRTSWAIPVSEQRRAASLATRGVMVDGAAPRHGRELPQAQACGAFADLPDEIVVIVLRNQGPRTLGRLARTCRRLHRIASSGALWSELFRRRFPRAYRARAASCVPAQVERMPWKQTYCDQVYEQWARRRYAHEQQKLRESERHKEEARQWCKVGGRGTQRLYNTVYPDSSRPSSIGSRTLQADGSPLRRPGSSSASLDSPVLDRSLGTMGSSFFMEQMAANTRQFLKPSNKKPFLKARAGERRSEQSRGRSVGRGSGSVAGAGVERVHGNLRRASGSLPQGQGSRRQRHVRPLSAAAPPGRPKGPSLAPPPTA